MCDDELREYLEELVYDVLFLCWCLVLLSSWCSLLIFLVLVFLLSRLMSSLCFDLLKSCVVRCLRVLV